MITNCVGGCIPERQGDGVTSPNLSSHPRDKVDRQTRARPAAQNSIVQARFCPRQEAPTAREKSQELAECFFGALSIPDHTSSLSRVVTGCEEVLQLDRLVIQSKRSCRKPREIWAGFDFLAGLLQRTWPALAFR